MPDAEDLHLRLGDAIDDHIGPNRDVLARTGYAAHAIPIREVGKAKAGVTKLSPHLSSDGGTLALQIEPDIGEVRLGRISDPNLL
jgi:hypothetical protein